MQFHKRAVNTLGQTNRIQRRIVAGVRAGIVQGDVESGAMRITVTPSGGAAVTVKPLTGELDVDTLGRNTACNGAEPISVQIALGK